MNHGPVAVGGVGGSGTRVVAEILQRAGVFLGEDLNDATDTLTFTLFFKHREAWSMPERDFSDLYSRFRGYLSGQSKAAPVPEQLEARLLSYDRAEQHSLEWLKDRLAHLAEKTYAPHRNWGWKEPNTHIVLDRLIPREPGLRYIHVLRDGISMALSNNQNQPRLWGGLLEGTERADTPRSSLKFWCAANRRALATSQALGKNHMVVSFEALVADPRSQTERILRFVGMNNHENIDEIAARVDHKIAKPRPVIDITAEFDAADLEYARSLRDTQW